MSNPRIALPLIARLTNLSHYLCTVGHLSRLLEIDSPIRQYACTIRLLMKHDQSLIGQNAKNKPIDWTC